ncbi:MAG TPA: DUF2460 domain-containing protein [Rickettsia endosymbiont of Proechinophthirus fluctus]|uniref:DUF2460 domain-containing protein n=1 Tax=Rickettsia endosymbiont of Proechinophthirus fluctus TaxID=1462733 RepID=UPI000789F9A5|nr:DUF2460 domain-containing protein [Rickettsia endosymbiont of Proechinophthirus fluctus]KYP98164.1 hypothetical protein BG75_04045 [Rickettsia endosymbiont of Proechinophthirus fluctus]HJD54640.1 DUF2460 domain-containing protein [Rickettsia endosymbiont of Proechinophthirus fluctus]
MKILSQLTSQKYLIKNARLSSTEFERFNSFFKARCGSNFALRFRNYYERVILLNRLIINNSVILYINVRTMGIVDYNDGIVTLPSPLGQDVILTADFIFDVTVRFSIDSFEYSYCNDGSIELYNIELVEVII